MEQEMAAQSNLQVQNVLNDLDGAIDYIANGTNTHPNRLDFIAETSRSAQSNGVFLRSNARQPHPGPSVFQNNRPQPGFGGPVFNQPQPPAQGFGHASAPNQNAPLGGSASKIQVRLDISHINSRRLASVRTASDNHSH